MTSNVVSVTEFKSLTLKGRGKVRDIYDLGDKLLIVASDRISAFDVVMPNPIPDKGRVLTQLSKFWFELTKEIVVNHVLSTEVKDYPKECRAYKEMLEGRSMLVTKTEVLPIECVVRGYLSGSGWEEYRKSRGDLWCFASQGAGRVVKIGRTHLYPCYQGGDGSS